MQLIRGLTHIPVQFTNACITIGNFDGVHLGHQQLIQQLKQVAVTLAAPSLLMTFEPYPREFFNPQQAPARLTNFSEKLRLLQKTPLDALLCLRFNRQFAELTAENFVQDILIKKLAIRLIAVGHDFRFGKDRLGDVNLLQQYAAAKHFQLKVIQPIISSQQQRISSTLIRSLLKAGHLTQAKLLLGRDYSICGRVSHGDKLGSQLGFPTANVRLARLHVPLTGVYAVNILGINHKKHNGVANIGMRPTVAGLNMQLEVHIFDFAENIYGKRIEIVFRHKIRDEMKFPSLNALKMQITEDINIAKTFFNEKNI